MYAVFQESIEPDRWVAEAIDFDNGSMAFTVVFTGPNAERRARDYADWQNESGYNQRIDPSDSAIAA